MKMTLPTCAGTYVLILWLAENKAIPIGRLGTLDFRCGYYAYVGSAFGPGGLAARLGRHLNPTGKFHWHVDYFRPYAKPVQLWFSRYPSPLEHLWAQAFLTQFKRKQAVSGFGCSDCACRSHLFFSQKQPSCQRLPYHQVIEKIVVA